MKITHFKDSKQFKLQVTGRFVLVPGVAGLVWVLRRIRPESRLQLQTFSKEISVAQSGADDWWTGRLLSAAHALGPWLGDLGFVTLVWARLNQTRVPSLAMPSASPLRVWLPIS